MPRDITLNVFAMLRQKWLLLAVCITMVGALFLPLYTADAADNAPPTKGLTLSPIRSEIEIEPGRSLDRTLKVINYSDKPMTIRLSAEKFGVVNEQYDYAFTADSDVSQWVTFAINEVRLDPGKSERIPYTIGVPLASEPGGRYISLFATTDASTSDNGIKSQQRIASLVYLTVKGEVSRSGHVVSLVSPWAVVNPDSWSMALRNSGSTHFRSRYTVNVRNIITKNVDASISGDALILPSTVRLIKDTLPVPALPGIYKIEYAIGLGDTPATTETRYVLYMPLWAIAIVIIAISLIVWLLRWRFHKN